MFSGMDVRATYLPRALGLLIVLIVVVLAVAWQVGAFDSDGDEDTVRDSDNDGFPDPIEEHAGTDPLDDCADNPSDNAWPPDFDNDGVVTDADLARITDLLGQAGEIAPARSDLDSDGAITGTDLAAVASRIGTRCAP